MDDFIASIRQWINIAIYVLGAQGETITHEYTIRAMEPKPTNQDRAIALWNARGRSCVAFDCSGLIVWALMRIGVLDYDMKAYMIKNMCASTSKASLQLGDFAFRNYSSGMAHHVGIVTRFVNGVPWITEAKGRDDGVIERSVDADPGYWDTYGKNPWIKEIESDMIYITYGDGRETSTSSSPAVKAIQEGLAKLGYATDADGRYGPATKSVVAVYKADNNLLGDGSVVDSNMVTTILAQLTELETGVSQEDYDSLSVKFVNVSVANGELMNKNDTLLSSLTAKRSYITKIAEAYETLARASDEVL